MIARHFLLLLILMVGFSQAFASGIEPFIGLYKGNAQISDTENRNLEVDIEQLDNGFTVSWKTITHDQSGSGKSKSYSINFVNSDRSGIYGAAMKTNLFGGQEALDPIKGEPFFWARINNKTLTIFGLLITPDGDYEIQKYDRTLEGDILILDYSLIRQEQIVKSIRAELTRQ